MVAAFNYKLYTADTSVIYPVSEWGTDYYIFTPSATPLGTFKEFSISSPPALPEHPDPVDL